MWVNPSLDLEMLNIRLFDVADFLCSDLINYHLLVFFLYLCRAYKLNLLLGYYISLNYRRNFKTGRFDNSPCRKNS